MLKKISFKDYKAFDFGEIAIKPITILLGANSVGKSSILQLILMLQQTALSEKNYKSALKLHGGYVSLGEGLNLIRRKDESKTLCLSFELDNANIYEELKNNLIDRFCEEMLYFASFIDSVYERDNTETKSPLDNFYKLNKKSNSFWAKNYLNAIHYNDSSKVLTKIQFKELISYLHAILKKNSFRELSNDIKDKFYYFQSYKINHFALLKESEEDYLLCYDLLSELSTSISKKSIKLEYSIMVRDKIPLLSKVSIISEDKELLSIEFADDAKQDYKLNKVKSSLVNIQNDQKLLDSFKNIFFNQSTVFSYVRNNNENLKQSKISSILSFYIGSVYQTVTDSLFNLFKDDNINYVSPLRAHPKRYYFLDKAKTNVYIDTLDGDAITEILKEKSDLKKQVNNWFKTFNLKIEVDHLQDIIHKLIVNQNELNLDITDVGFGISQVLPVIIQGFLSHQDSITLIEQPEIHLHPKMQADLADLFIDIVWDKKVQWKPQEKPKKFLIVETHSEYLLKRLRRRISDGTINSNLVAIYLINPQTNQNGAEIRELKIETKGHFEWPIDFYGGELLKDTTEFLLNQ